MPRLPPGAFSFAINTLQRPPIYFQYFTHIHKRRSGPNMNRLKTLHTNDGEGVSQPSRPSTPSPQLALPTITHMTFTRRTAIAAIAAAAASPRALIAQSD